MPFELKYKPFSERSILVEWPSRIDKEILKNITLFKSKIEQKNNKQILEIKNAYNSILLIYKNKLSDFTQEIESLKEIYELGLSKEHIILKTWHIPVCYDDSFGLDLAYMSKAKKLGKSKLIELHFKSIYTVYFTGFLPGFLYLGGLNEKLHCARKSTPRLEIEKGAVAIGGNQTGIYPDVSPGGWNIIGNSPINFFDISKNEPCFAKAGDFIKFYPVSLKIYNDIKTLVKAGVYELKSEVAHG